MKRYVVSIGLFCIAVGAGFYVSLLEAQMQGGKDSGKVVGFASQGMPQAAQQLGSQNVKGNQDGKPAQAWTGSATMQAVATPAVSAPALAATPVVTTSAQAPATPAQAPAVPAPAPTPASTPATPAQTPAVADSQASAQGQSQGGGLKVGQGLNPNPGLKLGQENRPAPLPPLKDDQVKVGLQATVGQLFEYINKNNPAKSSNFLILGDDKQSSFTAANKGIDQGWIKHNAGMQVTLQLDTAQEAATKGRSKKGPLLYFVANGINLYLFDPWPPMEVKSLKSKDSEKK